MNYLIIFIGAGFGGMARHAINVTAQRLFIPGIFPFSTLFINVVGSCLMGVVVGYFAARTGLPQQARLFLTTGVLGGFTTFSAFSMETTMLIERGLWFLAGLDVFTSVALSLGALLGGFIASTWSPYVGIWVVAILFSMSFLAAFLSPLQRVRDYDTIKALPET